MAQSPDSCMIGYSGGQNWLWSWDPELVNSCSFLHESQLSSTMLGSCTKLANEKMDPVLFIHVSGRSWQPASLQWGGPINTGCETGHPLFIISKTLAHFGQSCSVIPFLTFLSPGFSSTQYFSTGQLAWTHSFGFLATGYFLRTP